MGPNLQCTMAIVESHLKAETVDSGNDVPGPEDGAVKADAAPLSGERNRDLLHSGQSGQAALYEVHAGAARHSLPLNQKR